MTPECEVKEEIKKELKARGIPFFMPVQSGFGKQGVDFHCTLPPFGRALLIEAKRADGKRKATGRQLKCLQDNEKAGGISVVARCWYDVEEKICLR